MCIFRTWSKCRDCYMWNIWKNYFIYNILDPNRIRTQSNPKFDLSTIWIQHFRSDFIAHNQIRHLNTIYIASLNNKLCWTFVNLNTPVQIYILNVLLVTYHLSKAQVSNDTRVNDLLRSQFYLGVGIARLELDPYESGLTNQAVFLQPKPRPV